MATFLTRVQNLTGIVPSSSNLDEWLTAGTRYILGLIPNDKAIQQSQVVTGATSIGLFDKRILRVAGTNGVTLSEVPIDIFNRATSSGSYYQVLDPYGYYAFDGRTLLISTTSNKVNLFVMPTVLNSDSIVVQMTKEWEYGVVLYASLQVVTNQIATITQVSAPLPPSSASLSFATLNYAQVFPVTVDFITALSTDIAQAATQITTIASAITAVGSLSAPSSPSAPSFAYSTYTPATVSAVTIDFITALSADLGALGIYLDTNEDIELAHQKTEVIAEKIQQYVKQADLTMQKNLSDAQASGDNLKMKAASDLDATVKQYTATLEKFARDLESMSTQGQILGSIANYNIALLNSEIEKLKWKSEQYLKQADLTLQKNVHDADILWDANKTKAEGDFKAAVQQYTLNIERYGSQVASYQGDVANFQAKQKQYEGLLSSLQNQFNQFLMLNFGISLKQKQDQQNEGGQ